MKPCYIHGREGMQINMDGPALSIVAPGQAAVLIPLRRISRLVISGSPACETAALLACAERGITVTFLRHDGAIRAHVFGCSPTSHDLFAHLRDLLDRPDWPDRYQIWLNAAASRARRALCRQLRVPPDKLSLKQICTTLDRHAEQFVKTDQRHHLQRRLRGLCRSLANEVLQQAGLNAERSRYIEPRLNVPRDFARLLSLSLQLPLIEWLRRQPKHQRIDDRDVVALFEHHSHRLARIARTLTSRLHGFLVDLI